MYISQNISKFIVETIKVLQKKKKLRGEFERDLFFIIGEEKDEFSGFKQILEHETTKFGDPIFVMGHSIQGKKEINGRLGIMIRQRNRENLCRKEGGLE